MNDPVATPRPAPRERNPALREHHEERAEHRENRIADRITEVAGSMRFVYIHVAWFGAWIAINIGLLGTIFGKAFDPFPFGLLTMVVSLEAIFLSTFVMISQNRADQKRQVLADLQWHLIQEEDEQNRLLLDLSKQILELTAAIHGVTVHQATAARADQPAESPTLRDGAA